MRSLNIYLNFKFFYQYLIVLNIIKRLSILKHWIVIKKKYCICYNSCFEKQFNSSMIWSKCHINTFFHILIGNIYTLFCKFTHAICKSAKIQTAKIQTLILTLNMYE